MILGDALPATAVCDGCGARGVTVVTDTGGWMFLPVDWRLVGAPGDRLHICGGCTPEAVVTQLEESASARARVDERRGIMAYINGCAERLEGERNSEDRRLLGRRLRTLAEGIGLGLHLGEVAG